MRYVDVYLVDSDGAKGNTARVSVNVTAINDNTPSFNATRYNASVVEHRSGAFLFTVAASDNDQSNMHDPLTYAIQNCKDIDCSRLSLDQTSGTLQLNGFVDREELSAFQVSVSATDTAGQSTSTTVHINVLDINDNAPIFVSLGNDNVTDEGSVEHDVLENSVLNLPIVVDDLDAGTNGTISLKVREDGFFIEKNILRSNFSFDFEIRDFYNLTIVAMDAGSPALSSTLEVHIQVVDQNEFAPVFVLPLAVSVCEDTENGTRITVVNATDEDKDTIFFSSPLRHVPFTVDPSGEVYLDRPLNYETATNYDVTIVADDRHNHTTTAVLKVRVLNKNDVPVKFSMNRASVFVNESRNAGFTVMSSAQLLNLVVDDTCACDECADSECDCRTSDRTRLSLQYLEFTVQENDAFQIEDGSNLILRRMLDRESNEDHTLYISVNDTLYTDTLELTVLVNDTNDSPPTFQNSSYTASVLENVDIHHSVEQVRAFDPDLGLNAAIDYSIHGIGSADFVVDKMSGLVRTARSLDRERQAQYFLTVKASDQGVHGTLSASVPLNITVGDVNDNTPEFSMSSYVESIDEGSYTAMPVFRVVATDRDERTNSEITFSANVSGSPFTFDRSTGEFSATDDVDREMQDSYTFFVTAADGGDPSLSASVYVVIQVNDTNDNRPVVSNAVLFVSEGAPVNSVVDNLNATDADIDANARLNYVILGGNSLGHFSLDSNGDIIIASSLDRETVSDYMLTIEVTDSGMPALSSTATVHIKLTDVQDESPIFEFDNFDVNLLEHSPVGDVLVSLNASDADLPPYNIIAYSFETGTPDAFLAALQVDPSTGLVSVRNTAALDREVFVTLSTSVVVVKAYNPDLGPDGGDSAWINITLGDINDNAPKFNGSQVQNFSFPEDHSPSGHGASNLPAADVTVASVLASDLDIGRNGLVTYFILEADLPFDIDPSTGDIARNASVGLLDWERKPTYTFTVMAEDGGDPRRSSTITVNIHLRDINDNSPQFERSMYSVTVAEDTAPGPLQQFVKATDSDDNTTDNGRVEYSLIDSSVFAINTSTGELQLQVRVDRERVDMYTLSVVATNPGRESDRRDVAQVHVTLVDVNDNQPNITITNGLLTTSVPETVSSSVVLFGFSVTDADLGNNSKVDVTLGGSDASFFSVQSGEVRLGASQRLDFDRGKSEYSFTLIANDRGQPSLTSNVSLTVSTTNVNDEKPVIAIAPLVSQILEETSETRLRPVVTLSDLDEPVNPYFHAAGLTLIEPAGLAGALPAKANPPFNCTDEDKEKKITGCGFSVSKFLISDVTTYGTAVVIDRVLVLDGRGSYAIVGSYPGQRQDNSYQLTLGLWVKKDAITGDDNQTIIAKDGRDTTVSAEVFREYELQCTSAGDLLFVYKPRHGAQGQALVEFSGVCQDFVGVWKHLLIDVSSEQSGGSVAVYVDGNLKGRQTIVDMAFGAGRTYIGAALSSNGVFQHFFSGSMFGFTASVVRQRADLVQCFLECGESLRFRVAPSADLKVVFTSRVLTVTGNASASDYVALIDSVSHVDVTGEPYVGDRQVVYRVFDGALWSEPATQNLTLLAQNEFAPVLRLNGAEGVDYSSTFVEEGASVAVVGPGLTMTDGDRGMFAYTATISINISASRQEDEFLDVNRSLASQLGISWSFSPSAGTLTLSGTVEASVMQQLLRTVVYGSREDEPSSYPRLITFDVLDAAQPPSRSNQATTLLHIQPVNDPPEIQLGSAPAMLTYTEDGTPLHLFPTLSIVDDDNLTTLISATVTLVDAGSGDRLVLSTTPAPVSVHPSSNESALHLSAASGGAVSRDLLRQALRAITYQHSGFELPVPGPREVVVTAFDGVDTSVPVRVYISFAAVNDAPILSLSGDTSDRDFSTEFVEDSPGVAIASVNLTLSDPDNSSLSSLTMSVQPPVGNLSVPDTRLFRVHVHKTVEQLFVRIDAGSRPSAQIDDFAQILRSVQYVFVGDEFPANVFSVSVQVNASDGLLDSQPATTTVALRPVNDPPQIFLNGSRVNSSFMLVEQAMGGQVESSIAVRARLVDSDSTMFSLTVKLLSRPNGVDENLQSPSSSGTQLSFFGLSSHDALLTSLDSIRYINNASEPLPGARRVQVIVSDGAAQAHATAHLTVSVINDHPPIFASVNYTVSVQENTLTETLFRFSATDRDNLANDGAGVVFEIKANSGSGSFSLNDTTGVLSLAKPLDAEMGQRRIVQVTAFDGVFNTTVNLTVFVEDVNDNPPRFTPRYYNFTLSESSAHSTQVFSLTAVDDDITSANSQLMFALVQADDETTRTFRISPSSGVILLRPLDFESDPRRFYTLHVVVMNYPGLAESDTATVNITIADENDNCPELNVTQVIYIAEDHSVGASVAEAQATDRDGSTHHQQAQFALDDKSGHFTIGNHGVITLQSSLDRETNARIDVMVVLTEKGRPNCLESQNVTVMVTDVNDNAPQFVVSNNATIDEELEVGSYVTTVRATDLDIGSNAVVRYSILGGSRWFDVNSHSGNVTTVARIDREGSAPANTWLRISAVDQGSPALSSTTVIYVAISDVNDHVPVFTQKVYNKTVQENLEVGSLVVSVRAMDGDSTSQNNQVFYNLTGDYNSMFEVNRTSGEVHTLQRLDHESQCLFNFTVIAYDNGGRLAEPAQVIVRVSDVNEHTPTFSESIYNASVLENAPIGSSVLLVSANDNDGSCSSHSEQPASNTIIYTLFGDSSWFEIDKTGLISTTAVLDREASPSYLLTVVASDGLFSSTVQIMVMVTDVNDNCPQPDSTVLRRNLTEHTGLGSSLFDIDSQDSDAGNNSRIVYSVVANSSHASYFDVDSASGVVSLNRVLDYEALSGDHSVTLWIRVSDSGTIPCQVFVQLTVDVLNINDNPPVVAGVPPSSRFVQGQAPLRFAQAINITDADRLGKLSASVTLTPTNDSGACITSFARHAQCGVSNMANLFSAAGLPTSITANSGHLPRTVNLSSTSLNAQSLSVLTTSVWIRAVPSSYQALVSFANSASSLVTIFVTTIRGDSSIDLKTPSGAFLSVKVGKEAALTASLVHLTVVLDSNTCNMTVYLNGLFNGSSVASISACNGFSGVTRVVLGGGDSESSTYSGEMHSLSVQSGSFAPHFAACLGQCTQFIRLGDSTAVTGLDITQNAELATEISLRAVSEERLSIALRTLEYINLHSPPVEGSAIIQFNASDGQLNNKPTTHTINIVHSNTGAATIDLAGRNSLNFTENSVTSVQIVTQEARIVDADLHQTTADHITVTLLNRQDGPEEKLTVVGNVSAAITVHPLLDNTAVRLIGPATHGDFLQALQQIFYTNTAPEPSDFPRWLQLVVTDGPLTSDPVNITVYTYLVNDNPPAVDLNGGSDGVDFSTEYTEEGAGVRLASTNAVLNDGDRSQTTLRSVNVTLLNSQVGDHLWVTAPRLGGVQLISVSDTQIILSGPARFAEFQQAILSITFNNSQNEPNNTPRRVSISASDGDFSTTAITTVTIEYVNDNRPLFRPSQYNVTVTESRSVPWSLLRVSATDADDQYQESTFRYRMLDSSHLFKLNETSGELTLVASLDFEQASMHRILIAAIDNGSRAIGPDSTATVMVYVTDVNDNAPKFQNTSLDVTVDENSRVGSFVAQLSARDADSAPNAVFAFRVTSVGVPFDVDPSTGEVTVNGSLDFETETSYTVHLQVQGIDRPDFSDTATLQVTVRDVNDNPLVIQPASFTPLTLQEPQTTLSVFFDVELADADESAVLTTAIVRVTSPSVNGASLSVSESVIANVADVEGINVTVLGGSIAFSGSGSLASYQQLLRAVEYTDISAEPLPDTRVVELDVFDDYAMSPLRRSRQITISLINDNVPSVILDTRNRSSPQYTGLQPSDFDIIATKVFTGSFLTEFSEEAAAPIGITHSSVTITDADLSSVVSHALVSLTSQDSTSEGLVLNSNCTTLSATEQRHSITLVGPADASTFQRALRCIM